MRILLQRVMYTTYMVTYVTCQTNKLDGCAGCADEPWFSYGSAKSRAPCILEPGFRLGGPRGRCNLSRLDPNLPTDEPDKNADSHGPWEPRCLDDLFAAPLPSRRR